MKNLTFVLGFCLMSVVLSAQAVEGVQRTVIMKKTATWCPFCGQWGWTAFESLVDGLDDNPNAILLATHYSGDLTTDAGEGMMNNFNTPGQPNFYLNGSDQNISSSNRSSRIPSMIAQVNTNAEQTPMADVGMDISFKEGTFDIKAKVEFYEDVAGEYFLSTYVVEKTLNHRQSGQSGTPEHKKILRTALTNTFFGEAINDGDVVNGSTFDLNFSLEASSSWNDENLEVVAIIWKKEDSKYAIVNAVSSDEFNASTSTSDLSQFVETIKVKYSPSSEMIELKIDSKQTLNGLIVTLYDINGQKVQQLLSEAKVLGSNQWTLTTNSLRNAIYIVRISTQDGMLYSQKITSIN